MSKPRVHVMTGLPASGKSTAARKLDAVRFNLDDMRIMQGYDRERPQQWTKRHEEAVKEAFVDGIVATVDRGLDVCADNTHLTSKFPRLLRDRMHGKAEFVVHSFLDISVEECIRRDERRIDNYVGADVIRKMAKVSAGARKNGWTLDDYYMNIWPDVKPAQMNPENQLAILCDIDGTLALHSSGRGPYDMARCEEDTPNISVLQTLWHHHLDNVNVVLLSGRGEEYREQTVRWLRKYKVPFSNLFMRPEKDFRPDFVVKHELFKFYVEPYFYVTHSLDDRDQVVAIWRQLGLSCHAVNYGKF